MDEELEEEIERDTGIEEGEADRRINEFRDLVRRLEEVQNGQREILAAIAALGEREASIAIDNTGEEPGADKIEIEIAPDVNAEAIEADVDDWGDYLDEED